MVAYWVVIQKGNVNRVQFVMMIIIKENKMLHVKISKKLRLIFWFSKVWYFCISESNVIVKAKHIKIGWFRISVFKE